MDVLVVGSTGLLGTATCRAGLDRKHSVRAMHRPNSRLEGLAGLDVEKVLGDVNDMSSLKHAFDGMDAVVHCAPYYPLARDRDVPGAVATALEGTRNILQAARAADVGKLVFLSVPLTIAPAKASRFADETCAWEAMPFKTPYAQAKFAMEHEVLRAAAAGEAPAVVAIPTVTLGPWDWTPTTGALVLRIAKRKMPFYVDSDFNFVWSLDAGRGLVHTAEKGRVGERYILGGENARMRDFVRLVAQWAGVPPPRVTLPRGVAMATARASELLAAVTGGKAAFPSSAAVLLGTGQSYDTAKARNDLGYEPTATMAQAAWDCYNWFVKQGRIRPPAGGLP